MLHLDAAIAFHRDVDSVAAYSAYSRANETVADATIVAVRDEHVSGHGVVVLAVPRCVDGRAGDLA